MGVYKFYLLILVLLVSSACSNLYHHSMQLNPSLPQKPLIDTLSLTIGLYKPPTFIDIIENRSPLYGNTFSFPIGIASSKLIDQVLPFVFKSVVPIYKSPESLVINSKFDGIIEIDFGDFTYDLSSHSESFPDHIAKITYRFTLYDGNGNKLRTYLVNGIGRKKVEACFPCDTSEETEIAMLDAMANFMRDVRSWPEIKQMLVKH